MDDLIAAAFLFWPLFAGLIITLVIIGFLLAIFIGSTFIAGGFGLYWVYIFLRDEGFIQWMTNLIDSFRIRLTGHLKKNIEASFLVRGSLEKKGPVLYICHPHGLYGFSWYIHFSACLTKWPVQRPKLAVHSSFFRVPFIREVMYLNNCIQATEKEILETLQKGESVALVLGGIEELYKTSGGGIQLIVKKRNGFLRIAEKAKVPLVPLITVGENELFPFLKTQWLDEIQSSLYSWFHMAMPVPTWKSIKEWISIVDKPLAKPLRTYILDPVLKPIKKDYIQRILDFSKSEGVHIEIIA
jgi:1-acyl-sn-glycerol-3-phosphate acyltransferase